MAINYNQSTGFDINNGCELLVDFGNPKCFSVNEFPNPRNIFKWAEGSHIRCDLSADESITSPAGGIPMKMVMWDENDPYTNTYTDPMWNITECEVGDVFTLSVWVKCSDIYSIKIFIFEGPAASTSWNIHTAPNQSVGTTWKRIYVTHTVTDPTSEVIRVRFDGPDTAVEDGVLWFDGAQLERGVSTPTTFNPTYSENGSKVKPLITTIGDGSISDTTNRPINLVDKVEFSETSSFEFDGVFDSSDISIICWFYPFDVVIGSTDFRRLVSRDRSDYYSLCIDSDYKVRFTVRPITQYGDLQAGDVIKNQWNQIVATYNGSTGDENIYLNGELAGSTSLEATNGNLGYGTLKSIVINSNAESTSQDSSGADGYGGFYAMFSREVTSDEVKQNFDVIKRRYGI